MEFKGGERGKVVISGVKSLKEIPYNWDGAMDDEERLRANQLFNCLGEVYFLAHGGSDNRAGNDLWEIIEPCKLLIIKRG